MSNGIAHNNLNDISKIYLDTISGINKKEQSDDVKRWQNEETEGKRESPFKKKKNKDLPFTDDVSETKYQREAFSNWRTDLREVTSDAEATEIDNQPEIKEKKVKNKIKINPEFKEAVKEMGGELLEVKEVDAPDAPTKDDKKEEQDEAKKKKISDKERKLKMRILRVKMMATKQDAGASIVAGYEPHVSAIKKLVNERLGGKGYKSYTSSTGKKVSGDWEDSDRGAGNKATKRAGGKVDKKSPTYLAHVKNKKGHDCASKVKHEEYGIGDCISEMHDLDENGKVAHYDVEFEKYIVENVPVEELEILEGSMHEHVIREEDKKEEVEIDEGIGRAIKKGVKIAKRVAKDMGPYDPGGSHTIGTLGTPHLGNEDKRAKERAAQKKAGGPKLVGEEDKKGKGSGTKDACYKKVKASAKVWPSAYASGRLVQCRKKGAANYGNSKKESFSWRDELEFVNEGAAWTKKSGKNKSGGLNEKGRKSYEAENPGSDLKAPSKKVGNPRRKSFCARMKGMRKRQKPSNNTGDDRLSKSLRAWNCGYEPQGDTINELNRYEKETGTSSGSINMPKGKPTQKGGTTSPVMRAVRTKIRQETGKPTGQQKKIKGEKGNRQYGDRKFPPADTIAKRRQSRADAETLMRDTRGT